jgi:hypothetical protein
VTQNDQPASTPPAEEPARQAESARQEDPPTPEPAEDPGYLTETGEAAGEDGSVAPIIGGLPAVEGSAWDIGAPLDERGADPADDQAGQEEPR